ncbi:PBP1A family penicillin-binding protein [Patescibacteria group bacterium]|nr:PBP1A family penicillin-binding protein [Patescibacteria group bacterium]MBU4458708.1 PBP1A family penicillin-binding protein [Patescibacteria group bacterium]MCG2696187.1 PBP1A family penicillin-binding protein [Candidatus Portnoybacteria bacterium]
MPKIESYYNKKNKRFYFRRKFFENSLKTLVLLFILLFVIIVGAFVYLAKDIPSPQSLTERQITESTKIYDRTGKIILYDVHGEEKRTVISFEEIPQFVKDATITIEDNNFYHHFGLDIKGIVRSVFNNLIGKKILGQKTSVGGSTITQQFIKNAILTSEKTYVRKIKEAILAIELEMKYSKDEILNLYLNQVPYGSNAYGIEAAAQTFFNKNAKDLTLAESTLLAALTQAPSYYSPHGSHFETTKARQEYILQKMYEFGYINEEQMKNAKSEKLVFAPPRSGVNAPHFVMYVKEYIEDKYGRDYIEKAGLKVYTTLDWDLQQIAENAVKQWTEKNGKKYNAQNAALSAIDPKTGQILAMVGSKDYWADPFPEGCTPGKNCLFEGNTNVTIRPRQPGSSFKPFAYAKAFQKGFTPETMVFDLKTEFNPYCSSDATQEKDQYGLGCYHPKNYDSKFRGPISLRSGLAQSLNIPSVKTLYMAGVDETINLAQDMGIETLKDRSRYGLSLVLGGGEVKLLEETAAFGVFAAEGIKNPIKEIIKIEDSEGNIIEEYKNNPRKVMEPQIARLISDILSDENARSPMFGYKSNLYIEGIPVAAKTGTTQEYRDGWTVGYTPSLAVGVWAGNNDNTPMNREPGVVIAAPIWNEFIKKSYAKKQELRTSDKPDNYFDLPEQPEEFIKPDPISTDKDILNGKYINELRVMIDRISGKLATNLTPPDLIDEAVYPQIHCILYYINKDEPQNPSDGRNDPQFLNWEQPVLNWINTMENAHIYNQNPLQEYDNIHVPD